MKRPAKWPARTDADVYEGGGLLVLATTAVRADGGSYPALVFLAEPGSKLDAYEVEALSRDVDAWSSGLRSEARAEGNRAILACGPGLPGATTAPLCAELSIPAGPETARCEG